MKNSKHLSSLLLIALLLCTSYLGAQKKYLGDTIKLIDAILQQDINPGLAPGGVLTITRNGVEIYSKAYGFADPEHNIKNTPVSIFEAGSVSKQFAAAALLILVDEGKINLDDDVRKFIPELPDYGTPITVRNLFTHTSGIKDWGSILALAGWPRTTKVYTQDIARQTIFRQKSLNFEPGTEYSYCNSNYTLIVTLVERITKKTLAEFTRERIFNRIGMTRTGWRDDFRKIVPDRAIAYEKSGNRYLMDMPFEQTHGHSGLLTTTADLLKWNYYWMTGGFGESLGKLRLTHGVLKDGQEIEYSLGAVFQAPFMGENEISHSGATAGYRAWLAIYPKSGLSVAYLSNCANTAPATVGRKVIEVFLGENPHSANQNRVSLTREELQEKAGLYRSLKGHDVIELGVDGNELSYSKGGNLKALSKDSFALGSRRIIFTAENMIFVTSTHDARLYEKIPKYDPTAKELNAYAGKFYSEEADATLDLKVEDGKLIAYRTATVSLNLVPSYKDAFTIGRSILVEFKKGKKGKITGFSMSVERAENVQFARISD